MNGRARIGGTLYLPYQDDEGNDIPIESGEVIYKMSALSVDGQVVRVPATVIAEIRHGVLQPKDLSYGVWTADIRPRTPTAYAKRIKFLADKPEMNLSKVIPIPIDDLEVVKGDSAYDIARQGGFEGSLEEWQESIRGQDGKDGKTGPAGYAVGVNVKRIRKGLLSISGPSVARLKKGLVVVRNSAPSGLPPWSVNPLALMAGRNISSLWHDPVDNMIYSGYGDWTANGDEIGVVRHSVATGDAEVVYFPENGQSEYQPTFRRRGAWTEAIEAFYRFGDAIYIPHTDGAGYWEGCGYITNEGGEWHETSLPGQCLHLFAMAQTSEGLWAAGSAISASQADAGATLWFRPTGGDWTIRHQADAEGMGFSRFYQMRVADDRVWVHDSETMGQNVYGFNATDMVSRTIKTGENWYWNVTDQITVGDYTYRGGPMGKITKERKR